MDRWQFKGNYGEGAVTNLKRDMGYDEKLNGGTGDVDVNFNKCGGKGRVVSEVEGLVEMTVTNFSLKERRRRRERLLIMGDKSPS